MVDKPKEKEVDKENESGKRGGVLTWLTFAIAILAFFMSLYLFIDNTFVTDIDVYVGKHARLDVVKYTVSGKIFCFPADLVGQEACPPDEA